MTPIQPANSPETPLAICALGASAEPGLSCPNTAQQERAAEVIASLLAQIDSLKANEQRLEADNNRLALHAQDLYEENRRDPDTGLLNKRGFIESGEALLARGEPFALFVADLMSLKAINDHLGHSAGDRIIDETGKVLKFGMTFLSMFTLLGIDDNPVIGRLGGDEYGVIVPLGSINDLKPEQREAVDEALDYLEDTQVQNDDYTPVIRHSKDQFERARDGLLTYEDAASMIYSAIQRLYREEYLATNQDPDFGQGIAMGSAIFDPQSSEQTSLKVLMDKADVDMYADKAMQQMRLGVYDRRKQQRITPDRRSSTDRREAERRSGVDRRGSYQILGTLAFCPPSASIHPPKM